MIFGYSIGYMFFKKKLWEVYSHQRCGTSMEALDIPVGEQNGRERGLRGILFSGQSPRRFFSNFLPAHPTGWLETCKLRRSCSSTLVHPQATQLKGKSRRKSIGRLQVIWRCVSSQPASLWLLCIDCGNEATGFTVFTCQCIVSYFSIRHPLEQRYRLIRPQSLRSRCL